MAFPFSILNIAYLAAGFKVFLKNPFVTFVRTYKLRTEALGLLAIVFRGHNKALVTSIQAVTKHARYCNGILLIFLIWRFVMFHCFIYCTIYKGSCAFSHIIVQQILLDNINKSPPYFNKHIQKAFYILFRKCEGLK